MRVLNVEKIVLFEGVKILNELRGLFKIHLLVVYYLLDLFVLSALDELLKVFLELVN